MTEPGRPDPGFHVAIIKPEKRKRFEGVELARALQDAYDIAVNSLDFGSGFLSTEEVNNLRLLGKAIGAEPLHYKDTPGGSWCQFSPGLNPYGEKVQARSCNCGAITLKRPVPYANAPKTVWLSWCIDYGLNKDQAERMTKEQLKRWAGMQPRNENA